MAQIPATSAIALRVGVISDTHGLLRPQATAFLRGCDHIVHGGDIGSPEILEQLATVAPVTAVRGNNDTQAWSLRLPATCLLEIGGIRVFVIHDVGQLNIDPAAAAVRVIVSGHSHQPSKRLRDGVIYLNPGSAGPRRFKLPISVADITISGSTVTARLEQLHTRGG
ncbi:MAG TPA: metallophosphoesterase family protein, partial [Steroidobacteraceae bacterium]